MEEINESPILEIMKKYSGVIKKHSKLLTREEEFELISNYQAPIKKLEKQLRLKFDKSVFKSTNQYNNWIKNTAKKLVLTKGSKYYDKAAAYSLDKMVKHNLGLITKHAKQAYAKQSSKGNLHLEEYDHFIEGLLGFIHALDKFDLTRRTEAGLSLKSSTYTTRWVRQNIRRGIQDHENTIRIPIHIHDKIDKIRRVMGQWCSDHPDSLSPPPKKLAEIYNEKFPEEPITEEECGRLGRYVKPLDELDSFIGGAESDESQTGHDFLAADDEKYSPDVEAEVNSNKANLLKLINHLEDERMRLLLHLRYGTKDNIDRTVKETAHILGIKPREVEKIEEAAIALIKKVAVRENFNY